MGAGEIDSLEIKIQANAQKANQSLDALVGKLDRLTTSLGRVSGNSLSSLSNGVQRLANSMQSMKNVGTADFTRLAKNISKMGEIDAAGVGKAASSLHRFSNALSKLDTVKVSDNAAQIWQLANGIKQLGYKSSTQAIENIPKLATAMRQLMTELSKAPKVSQNLIQMTEALARLSRTGASSGRAATSLGKALDSYTSSTHRASKGSFSLSAAIGKVYATYWLLFRAFGKIKDAINISSQLTEVQNVVDVTFGNMSRKVEEFAKTSIQQFGMSELSLKQYASRFQAMGSAMGISGSSIGSANSFLNKQTSGYVGLSNSMADVSLNLTKLTADMASFYNVEQSAVAEDLASVFTGQTRPLRQYGLDLTQATLQEWALKNGIDADIKSMSQAEKTMLRYQYVMANTGAAQGDFARTANTWANQVRILKQNFEQLGAVVGGTLINAFKPLVQALNSVMGHLIAFAETVSNALGKIFGWKYESGSGGAGTTGLATDMEDAADSAGDIAGSTGKAAKNIDKMEAGLRAFDELKTISTKDSGSGSGSGIGGSAGGAGASGGSGGQWVKQDSIFDDYKSSIDSLYGLGEYIGGALMDAMDGIHWDSIYQKADQFGSGLASFLNGMFEGKNGETLLGCVGTTIAGTLNTVLHGLDSFGKTFSWEQFGVNLSQGLNNFFSTFDVVLAADTINTWAHGILTTITKAVSTTDWPLIGEKIAEFLSNIDYGQLLVDAIKASVSLVNAADGFVDGLKKGFDPSTILKSLKDGLGQLDFSDLFDAFTTIIEYIPGLEGLSAALDFTGIKEGYSKLIDAVESFDFEKWYKEDVSPWFTKQKWQELGKNAKDGIVSKWNEFVAWWKQSGAYSWLTNNVKPYFTKEKWIDISKGIIFGLQSKWDEFSTWWKRGGANKWLESNVKPWFTKEKWASFSGGMKSGLSSKWSEFTSWWKSDGFAKWWSGVKGNFSKEKWIFSGISSGLKAAWNNAIAGIKVIWNNFAKWLNDKLNLKWDAVNIGGKEIIKAGSIRLGKVPTFSTGGFPEDGLFMANHSELIGRFSNGRTAVANNDQITQGLADAIYPAVYNAVSAAIKNNSGSSSGSPEIRVFVGNRELTDIAIDGINERTRRTGRTPIELA